MNNASKRRRSALPGFACIAISLAACSGNAGSPVAPIRGASESTPTPVATPTIAATASPTPVASASASPTPVATASPTAKPTATPTAKPTSVPTATPTASPGPSATPVGSTQCAKLLASGSLASTGFVLIPVDGSESGFQRIQFESGGAVSSAPASTFCQTYSTADADNTVQAIASKDGSRGLVIGLGLNGTASGVQYALPFYNGFTSTPLLGPGLSYAAGFPGLATAVVIPDTGDEVVLNGGDNTPTLLQASGINSGVPKAAGVLTIPGPPTGLVLSSDGHTLVIRTAGFGTNAGLATYSITAKTPSVGPLGGTLAHTYTKIGTLSAVAFAAGGGRGAMSADPADPSRAVLTGVSGSGGIVAQLITGVSSGPTLTSTVTVGSNSTPTSIAVSRDGKYAYIATQAGIATVSGVDGTKLVQVGALYLPASAPRLNTTQSLATSLDGKYLIAATGSGSGTQVVNGVGLDGELVVIPIGANGVLGNPVLVDDDAGGVEDDSMVVF